jgi:hypothetical protein
MPSQFEESTARLQRLVRQIMKETDPAVYDQLAEEIWRVLAERESLATKAVASTAKELLATA